MSEWITDRLPTVEDCHAGCDDVWVYNEKHKIVVRGIWQSVWRGLPWQPIQAPAPYVKPKRWTVKYDIAVERWKLYCDGDTLWVLPYLSAHGREAAQRIADVYNEVMP
jgi:hypothetical protein